MIFGQQLVGRFYTQIIQRDTVNRTHLLALRLIKMADTLGAQIRVDVINLGSHVNRFVGTLGLTYVTVDAFVCYFE